MTIYGHVVMAMEGYYNDDSCIIQQCGTEKQSTLFNAEREGAPCIAAVDIVQV
jgi:hypothetical protein